MRVLIYLAILVITKDFLVTGTHSQNRTDFDEFDDDDFGEEEVDDAISIVSAPLDPTIVENATVTPVINGPADAIISGQQVRPHKYPFVVSLQLHVEVKSGERNYHFCGGSLISSVHILTAAHCLADNSGKPNVPAATSMLVSGYTIGSPRARCIFQGRTHSDSPRV
ncbi:hypothetical protein BV898_10800 [Hypsibius exemplaris]|uniref:Peptidase S1 domain-containing protein n=1 Tax=Hypsibius exemplaris TaxID=2072580 RepID=A0A1W0WIK0_HYPEX|nr:hypothetical protein BV898_10800 [Hypsibius exemplaris]